METQIQTNRQEGPQSGRVGFMERVGGGGGGFGGKGLR